MKSNADDLKPCPHMRVLISAWIDGALSELARWYTTWHLAHCPRCQAAAAALRAMRDRLRALSARPHSDQMGVWGLAPERWQAVEEGWKQTDSERGVL